MSNSLKTSFSLYRTYLLRSLILERLLAGRCSTNEMASSLIAGTRDWPGIPFNTTLSDVSKELLVLEKLGFVNFSQDFFTLTPHGETANRNALYQGLASSTFLAHRSLELSMLALVISVIGTAIACCSLFLGAT